MNAYMLKTHHILTCGIEFPLDIFQERESSLRELYYRASAPLVTKTPYKKGLLSCQLSSMGKHHKQDGRGTHLA